MSWHMRLIRSWHSCALSPSHIRPLCFPRSSQEQVAPCGKHRHVREGQRNERDCEESQVVHEHEIVEKDLGEQRVHEERGEERNTVECHLRKQVLKTWHWQEGQDEVEEHVEHRSRGVAHGVLEDHLVRQGQEPHSGCDHKSHWQSLPRQNEERQTDLREPSAQR